MSALSYTPEQEAAIKHKYGNLLVSASAGSGKTFVMISRVIDLVLSGEAKVSEILALTFTNLAADEMRQKLIKELVKAIARGENTEKLKEALADVATADFSTFHGFLAKILRTYFYASVVDPLFSISDETDAQELKNRAIERLFEKKYDETNEEFLYLVRIYRKNRSDEELKKSILSLWEFTVSEADKDGFLTDCSLGASEAAYLKARRNLIGLYKDRLNALLTDAKSLLDDCEFSGAEKLCADAKAVNDRISAAINAENEDNFRIELSIPLGRKPPAPKDDETLQNLSARLGEVRDAFKKICGDANNTLFSVGDDKAIFLSTSRALRALVALVREFDKDYSALKRAENKVDFSDIEHLALDLLVSNEEIRAEIAGKYKFAFADEYQDVNGVQEKILSLITNGNLFMVGDVKQSIYAFRGCNPDIFAEKYERYLNSDGGTALSLNENFRSANAVLSAVNNVFSRIMTKNFGKVDYAAEPMRGSSLYGEYRGEATLHIIEGEKREKETASGIYNVLKAYNSRGESEDYYEGLLIAKLICDEVGKPIYDIKTGETRPAAYGDIAVLTRSLKGGATRLVKELAKFAIPVTTEAGVSLKEFPEIKLLIDILKLISYYADDAPLAAALKSEIGKLDDEDLAEIRRPYVGGNKTFAECVALYEKDGNSPLKEKLTAFREYFEKIRLLAEFKGADEILTQILKDTGLDLEIAAMPLGEVRLQRVESFIAESVVGGKALSVNEFLKRIETDSKDMNFAPKGGADTVKVMTIHASKGLEYPIVIIAGISRAFSRQDRVGEILSDRSFGLALKAYDEEKKTCYETVARDFLKEKNKTDGIKEEARVFYVAMTRAKCKLHLVCDGKIKDEPSVYDFVSANSYADFLCTRDMKTVRHDRAALCATEKQEASKVFVGEGRQPLADKILAAISFNYPFAGDTALKIKSAVTKIAEDSAGAPAPALADEEPAYSKFGSSAEKGTTYHKFMQYCDFDRDAKSELARLVKENVLSAEEEKLLNASALETVLSLDVIKRLNGYTLYREQPFMAFFAPNEIGENGENGKTLVQGVIDLLAVKGDEAIIIDYKASRRSAAQLVNDYAVQLDLYAKAVERTLGLKVKDKIIINLLSGETATADNPF